MSINITHCTRNLCQLQWVISLLRVIILTISNQHPFNHLTTRRKMMDIKSREIITISQLPSAANNYTAVCIVQVTLSNDQVFSSVGIATGSTENNCGDILAAAEQDAFNNAMQSATSHASTTMPFTNPTSYQNYDRQKQQGTKPITDKQKRLIETTAMHNSQTWDNAQAISQQLHGKPIEKLTTKEVNPILDELELNGSKQYV